MEHPNVYVSRRISARRMTPSRRRRADIVSEIIDAHFCLRPAASAARVTGILIRRNSRLRANHHGVRRTKKQRRSY